MKADKKIHKKPLKAIQASSNSFYNRLSKKVSDTWSSEKVEPKYTKIIAFFLLGILGLLWIPFYPVWMIVILSFILAAISSRFPYISLLFLGLFVSAAASYQTAEFGIFMLATILVVMIASLFDWKFGFLVFMAIFLSKLGLAFVVPIMAVMLYTTFTGLAVGITSGLVLIFIVTCGNLDAVSFMASAPHVSGFVIFSNPIKPDFIPTDIGEALMNVQNADGSIMADIISTNLGASVAPYLTLIIWCIAYYVSAYAKPAKSYESLSRLKNSWLYVSITISVLIMLSFFISYWALHGTLSVLAFVMGVLIIPIVLATVAFTTILKWEFKQYFARSAEMAKGTSVAGAVEVSKTTFENVGGLGDIKEDVRDSILVPLLKKDVARHYGVNLPKGILLFGPPGCGKTLLMKALASELRMDIIIIKCNDLMSKWYGESESRIEQLFKEARERKPSIVFLDDIDTIARSRDLYSADDVTPRLLGMILSELDGMAAGTDMMIVGSTNKPEVLDSAILRPGRFDKIIYVPPPNERERKEILKIHLKGKPAKGANISRLARSTEGFSGADIANMVNEAAIIAMKSALKSGEEGEITLEHFNEVLRSIKPSITDSMLQDYENYKARFERKLLRVTEEDKMGEGAKA